MRQPNLVLNTEFKTLPQTTSHYFETAPQRPAPRRDLSRWLLAWRVLTGKYDAVYWRGNYE